MVNYELKFYIFGVEGTFGMADNFYVNIFTATKILYSNLHWAKRSMYNRFDSKTAISSKYVQYYAYVQRIPM